MQVWMLLGELEVGRLTGDREIALEDALQEAARTAKRNATACDTEWQRAICIVFGLLPELPAWARLAALRLVLPGLGYVECPNCEELLDVEWDGSWSVGGLVVKQRQLSDGSRAILDWLAKTGQQVGVPALENINELAGIVSCPECGEALNMISLLSCPLALP